MRVLHVIPAIARRYGGPSAAVLQMCRALGDAGHRVTLATTNANGPGVLDVPIGTPVRLEGVDAVVFPRQWSEAFKYSWPLRTWLNAQVADFDVVHIHALLSHACLAAARACRRAHVPFIVRPLGTLDPWSLAQKPWRKRLLLMAGGRRALAAAAAVHYTAATEREHVEAAFTTRGGFVSPLGIGGELFEDFVPYARRGADPFVLAISRLHPVKALDHLIDAFAATERGRWRLIIAGDGDARYARWLRARAAASAAADAIEFAGWVDGSRKLSLLRNASLLVLPSHHENFGVGLAEAMACGTPALVSRHVLVAREIAEAGAGWMCGNTVPALAEALGGALADEAGRSAASQAARAFAERLAWPRVAASLTEAYERVVADGGGRLEASTLAARAAGHGR